MFLRGTVGGIGQMVRGGGIRVGGGGDIRGGLDAPLPRGLV